MEHFFSLIMEHFMLKYLYEIWPGLEEINIRLGIFEVWKIAVHIKHKWILVAITN
jgi:hypothetical protein